MNASMWAPAVWLVIFGSTEALAEGGEKKERVYLCKETRLVSRRVTPQVAVDLARIVPRAPLPVLRQPLFDLRGEVIQNDPF